MPDLIDDLRRYGEALEAERLPEVLFPGVVPDSGGRSVSAGRGAWWTVAAAIFVVALVAGLVIRAGDHDPGPSVGTEGRPVLPLLGFEGQSLQVSHFEPDRSYTVLDAPEGLESTVRVTLSVSVGPGTESGPLGPSTTGPDATESASTITQGSSVTIGDGDQEVPLVRRASGWGQDILVATWNPSAGVTATLTADPADPEGTGLQAMRSAASRVVALTADDFVAALSTPGPNGQNLAALVTSDAIQTALIESYPDTLVTLAFHEPSSSTSIEMVISGPGAGSANPLPAGTPLEVRGTTGTFASDDQPALDGTVRWSLTWKEGEATYTLTGTGTRDPANVAAFADSLHEPSMAEWTRVLFPSEPQTVDDLPAAPTETDGGPNLSGLLAFPLRSLDLAIDYPADLGPITRHTYFLNVRGTDGFNNLAASLTDAPIETLLADMCPDIACEANPESTPNGVLREWTYAGDRGAPGIVTVTDGAWTAVIETPDGTRARDLATSLHITPTQGGARVEIRSDSWSPVSGVEVVQLRFGATSQFRGSEPGVVVTTECPANEPTFQPGVCTDAGYLANLTADAQQVDLEVLALRPA